MTGPVRWGVMGTARIATNRLIPAMHEARLTTLLGIASRTLAKAEDVAQRFDIPRAYGSYEEMLEDPEIEVVYIPLPNGFHAEWCIKSMRAGKHVLCEKPITLDADEARQIEAVRDETGLYCLEAFASRFNPVQERAVEIVRSGALGEPRFMHTISTFLMAEPDPENVRLRVGIGGGALYDMGCYAIDAQRLLAGRIPERAWAEMAWSERFDVDMAGAGVLDFGDGLMGTIQWGFNAPWGGPFSVLGERGTLTGPHGWGAPEGQAAMLLQREGQPLEQITGERGNGHMIQVQDLSEALRGEHAPKYEDQSLVENMRIIDALYASHRSGHPEEV
jgi:D-xylose 1-dehydrogenase (NADP+, D-xylono-1,5-lactone-forming)